MKSFQEIYNQTLAEVQTKRLKERGNRKTPLGEQPCYTLNINSKIPNQTKPRETPSGGIKKQVLSPQKTRILTDTQKQALEFFRRQGEILDQYSGVSDIKKAFRRLAKKLHPDKTSPVDQEIQRIRAGEFHQLHLAYRHLIDTLH